VSEPLKHLDSQSIITGWDFSTGGVKCLAFDTRGNVVAQTRLPTDLWRGEIKDGRLVEEGCFELNVMQLEGQARASTRAIAAALRDADRLDDWAAGGISATHHTAGRIDANRAQVRRAICWNDYTLTKHHARGVKRLGGQKKVHDLIGGPWAIRYSLSHLVKDEQCLAEDDWERTWLVLCHGPLAAGFLTGNFAVTSVSSAASTGIMDLRTGKWRRDMLDAIGNEHYRKLAWKQLPKIVDHFDPIGPLADHVALEAGVGRAHRPIVYPTSDDQAAGLVGGGAVDDGQVAVILGNSAVVNSSSNHLPQRGNLDVMKLNWGPYLWMRCYNNGAQFVDDVIGRRPEWPAAKWSELEKAARRVPAGCDGKAVWPFVQPEPSLKVSKPGIRWFGDEPKQPGVRFRAALEALAYLIALGVREHEKAGQSITRVTVSGGLARSDLMCEVLATVLGRRLERLASDEGPALGAAVTALAAHETNLRWRAGDRDPFTVADAVATMVRFRGAVEPVDEWGGAYAKGLREFEKRLKSGR
jgi:sugar (pentulose or hexulose) kinase